MMKCRSTQRHAISLLAAGCGDVLEATEMERAQAHLAGCESCQTLYFETGAVCKSLKDAADLQAAEFTTLAPLHPKWKTVGRNTDHHSESRFSVWRLLRPVMVVSGIAIASLILYQREPEPAGQLSVPAHSLPPPTLLAYRQAAQTERGLEILLQRHSATLLPPDGMSLHAMMSENF